MTRLNFGARESAERQYDEERMHGRAETDRMTEHMWNAVARQATHALAWADNRGNAGDGVPRASLRELRKAAKRQDADAAVTAACGVLSGKQHPTARDVCSEPAKTLVYNLCGRRAHTFRTDN